MTNKITLTFWIAALYNTCIILFSKGFSNNLGEIDAIFSPGGSFCILLWGAAYFAMAKHYHSLPGVALVFCIEKAFYGSRWLMWITAHHTDVPGMIQSDPLTGLFYAIYGVGDLLFMVFFGWVAWRGAFGQENAIKE